MFTFFMKNLSKFEKKMTNQLQGTKVTKFDFIRKVCRKIRQRPPAPKSQSMKFDKPLPLLIEKVNPSFIFLKKIFRSPFVEFRSSMKSGEQKCLPAKSPKSHY